MKRFSITMTHGVQKSTVFEHRSLPLLKNRVFLSNAHCPMLNKLDFLNITLPIRPTKIDS